MQAHTEHRGRASVAIVGWIDDQLIVQRDLRRKPRKAVKGLEDSFIAGMRQLSIANENSEPAGIEKGLMHADDAVDGAGDAEGVVVAAPYSSRHQETSRRGPIDVGEVERLLVPIGVTGPREETDIGRDLLLQIHADAAAALILAHGGDVGGFTSHSRQQ